MYKLFLHPTEKRTEERPAKSSPLLQTYLDDSPRIQKEFVKGDDKDFDYLSFSMDGPDLLVIKRMDDPMSDPSSGQRSIYPPHCAFEFKFGMDLVSGLNSELLEDELTRMKAKYSQFNQPKFPSQHLGPLTPTIPLYLVIVNEYDKQEQEQVISPKDLARAVTIAQNLNIRVKYCDNPSTFAKKVFDLIRFPPKEVDLGQRFVKKSSGSEFNRSLQCYNGVTKEVADKIENRYKDWFWLMHQITDDCADYTYLESCFTTDSGRFMKANMEKFLRKVSGK